MIRLTHIITGLSAGGAENMLYRLLSRLDSRAFASEVISLKREGPVADKIRSLGIPLKTLNWRSGRADPLAWLRLWRWLRSGRPDVVQTWMYHADLIGGLAAKAAGRAPVVWNVRQTNLDPAFNKRSTLWTARFCASLSSRLPSAIVCNSEAAKAAHVGFGYSAGRFIVIPNGFDLSLLRPDPEARLSVRREIGLEPSALLVGLVARFDPVKGHRVFLRAAGLLLKRHPAVNFLLCGEGIDMTNPSIVQWMEEAGVAGRCRLLGRREDLPRIQAALDLAVSASSGESFPNVIGEAMACGVPCAVTDVGDSALIVGNTGRVVPPQDPHALATAIDDLIRLGPDGRRRWGEQARQRIRDFYSLPATVAKYEALYRSLAKHG
jgi:glycosyltransferase involved in cell wall biosynthesis